MSVALAACKDSQRITVLEFGKPVGEASVRVYFDSCPDALEAKTDAKGFAAFHLKHPELVTSVGIFTRDGREIAVLMAKKWPLVVEIDKRRKQVIK